MDQPTSASNDYTPSDHLITLKTVNGPKAHYPFCWQQYEFRLRHPDGIIDAQIIQADTERDPVVIKVTAKADDLGNCVGVGLHTGSLTTINQVLERAKAQALADLGVGCTWPIVFDDDLDHLEIIPSAPIAPPAETPATSNAASATTGFTHYPARTASSVQAWFAKTYKVSAVDLDARWARFKMHVLEAEIADHDLTEEQLHQLNGYISQDWQKQQQGQRSVRKVS